MAQNLACFHIPEAMQCFVHQQHVVLLGCCNGPVVAVSYDFILYPRLLKFSICDDVVCRWRHHNSLRTWALSASTCRMLF